LIGARSRSQDRLSPKWHRTPGLLALYLPESVQPDTNMHFDKELDARGLNCPLPILRTKKALSDMVSGQILKITATDPGSVRDFQAFSKQTGHSLVSSDSTGDMFTFFMQKK
jgi:tRNA 2-thiouridine synthesizing protein A